MNLFHSILLSCGLLSTQLPSVYPVGMALCPSSGDPGDWAVATCSAGIPLPTGMVLRVDGSCDPAACWMVGGYRCSDAGQPCSPVNVTLYACGEPGPGEITFVTWEDQ